VHGAEIVIDNAIGAASFFLLRTTEIGRSTIRQVSPGNRLLEQLSFPFFQKGVDFHDEFIEFCGPYSLAACSQSSRQRCFSLPIIRITLNFPET
jgi:hypothetical protein